MLYPFSPALLNMLLGCLLLWWPALLLAQQPELEWCLDHLPPRQNYLPHQQPTGPVVDMMQQLARQSGFTLKFSPPTPVARCLKLMQQGKTDLMTGLLWSESREPFMLLLPFDEARAETLFSRKADANKIRKNSDLAGLTIAIDTTRHYSRHFLTIVAQQQAKIKKAADLEQALALLHYGDVDLVAGPQQITLNALKNNPRLQHKLGLNNWQLPKDKSQHNHLALSRTSPHFVLHHQISQQLQLMVAQKQTHFYPD